ncbi:E3 ubiquitin-protein ligase E3D [Batrachochytrium dendrobatidis]
MATTMSWINCQLLSSLKQLKLTLAPSHSKSTRVLITPNTIDLTTINSAESDPLSDTFLCFSETVDPSTLNINQSGHYVTLSLAIQSMDSIETTTSITPDSAHTDMTAAQNWSSSQSIQCHNCKFNLTNTSQSDPSAAHNLFERHVDLPSQHWHEMLECWACHHEDYSSTLQGQQGGLILAQKNAVLVGDSYILLHPDTMQMDRLAIIYTGNESIFRSTRWIRVVCKRCRHPVGECFMDDGAALDSTDLQQVKIVKLFKYRIDAMIGSGRPLHTSFPDCFIEEIMDIANAHATYRFYIHDEDSLNEAKPLLYIWLFSTHIQSVRIRETGRVKVKQRPAIKVLYKTFHRNDPINNHPDMSNKQNTERLYMASDLVVMLIKLLHINSEEQLPAPERKMLGFKASVLFYSRPA